MRDAFIFLDHFVRAEGKNGASAWRFALEECGEGMITAMRNAVEGRAR